MLSRVRPAVILLALLAVALGLPVAANAADGATPRVGQCHQLTWAQGAADSDTKPAVSCRARHNLQTFAVVTSSMSLSGMSDDEISTLGIKLCYPRYNRLLGRTAVLRAQSSYDFSFFRPTAAQIASGARWIRCDIDKVANNHYVQLRKRLTRPALPAKLSNSDRLCMTGAMWRTTCDRRHAWRAIDAVVVRTSAYPTSEQVIRAANRNCPKTLDFVRWPSEAVWAAGNHVAVCYDRTRR